MGEGTREIENDMRTKYPLLFEPSSTPVSFTFADENLFRSRYCIGPPSNFLLLYTFFPFRAFLNLAQVTCHLLDISVYLLGSWFGFMRQFPVLNSSLVWIS